MQNRRRLQQSIVLVALTLVSLSTAASVVSRTCRSPNGWRGSYAPFGSYHSRVNPSIDYQSVDVRVGLKSQYLNQPPTSSSVVTATTLNSRVVQQPTDTSPLASVQKEDRQHDESFTIPVKNPPTENRRISSAGRDQTSYIPLKQQQQQLKPSNPIRTQVALHSDKLVQSRGDDVIGERIQNKYPSHDVDTSERPQTVTGHQAGELDSLVLTRTYEPDHGYLMTVYPNLPELLSSSHNNNEGVQITNHPQYKLNSSPHSKGTLRVIHDAKLLTPPQGYLPAKYIPFQSAEPRPPSTTVTTTSIPTTTTTATAAATTTSKQPAEVTTKRPADFKPSQYDIQYLPFTPQDASYFHLDTFSEPKPSPHIDYNQDVVEPSSRTLPEARNSFRAETTVVSSAASSNFHQNASAKVFKPEFYSDFKPMLDVVTTTTTVKPVDEIAASSSFKHEETYHPEVVEVEPNYKTYSAEENYNPAVVEDLEDNRNQANTAYHADTYSYTYPESYANHNEENDSQNYEYPQQVQPVHQEPVFDEDSEPWNSEEEEDGEEQLVSKVVVVAETKNANRKKQPAYSLENRQTISGKFSPKGVMYTVTQGLSKVKFFGNNPLHGKGQPLIYMYQDEADWKRDDYLPLSSSRNPALNKKGAYQRRKGASPLPLRRQKITRPDDLAQRAAIASPLSRRAAVNQ